MLHVSFLIQKDFNRKVYFIRLDRKMDEQNKKNDTENTTETWSEEELQRDVERRKMLIIFCVVAWNMAFYVFALLPLASIYKLANPYWLALANAMISLSLGILLYKKQRFEPLSSSEQQENPKEETV